MDVAPQDRKFREDFFQKYSEYVLNVQIMNKKFRTELNNFNLNNKIRNDMQFFMSHVKNGNE